MVHIGNVRQNSCIIAMLFISAIIKDGCLPGHPVCVRKMIPPEKSSEWVILLHGLGRTRRSMRKIEKRLKATGFKVWNKGYPSTSKTMQALTEVEITEAVAYCHRQHATKIHFVTHSLGGILVRLYLQENKLPDQSKIVMLCPPNHGSEVIDKFKKFTAFKWLLGPAGQALGTQVQSMPNRLRPVQGDIGVIAGEKSRDPWFSSIIPGENDGKVSVASTRLKEMNDFITVKCGHTFIMNNREVMNQIVFYLQNGQFRH